MINRKVKRLNLGFEIGDDVSVDEDQLYYCYSQFIKKHKKFADRWQYRRWIDKEHTPLHAVGVYKHVQHDKYDKNKYCVVIEDTSGRIYLVGETGVKKVGAACSKSADNAKEQMVIDIQGKGQTNHFLSMLAWIELLGGVGHSASFQVIADGDGSTRWKFKFKDANQQNKYDALKKTLLKENINSHKDIEFFEI